MFKSNSEVHVPWDGLAGVITNVSKAFEESGFGIPAGKSCRRAAVQWGQPITSNPTAFVVI